MGLGLVCWNVGLLDFGLLDVDGLIGLLDLLPLYARSVLFRQCHTLLCFALHVLPHLCSIDGSVYTRIVIVLLVSTSSLRDAHGS